MNISQTSSYLYTSSLQKTANNSNAASSNNAQVSASDGADSGVKRYDFTNISRGELLDTVNNLIKSGQMSLDESSPLVLLMGPKISLDGSNIDASNEKVDVFSMLKQSIAFNNSIGNTTASAYDTKAMNFLQKLQGNIFGLDIKA